MQDPQDAKKLSDPATPSLAIGIALMRVHIFSTRRWMPDSSTTARAVDYSLNR